MVKIKPRGNEMRLAPPKKASREIEIDKGTVVAKNDGGGRDLLAAVTLGFEMDTAEEIINPQASAKKAHQRAVALANQGRGGIIQSIFGRFFSHNFSRIYCIFII